VAGIGVDVQSHLGYWVPPKEELATHMAGDQFSCVTPVEAPPAAGTSERTRRAESELDLLMRLCTGEVQLREQGAGASSAEHPQGPTRAPVAKDRAPAVAIANGSRETTGADDRLSVVSRPATPVDRRPPVPYEAQPEDRAHRSDLG
jgi:hypothetical protein